MNQKPAKPPPAETTHVDLKNPGLAALLAWLWPGAGHLYQGRIAKGVLYMVCITSVYFYGLAIGHGHVVYASWRPYDRRLPYLCQVGVGLPALPAMVQASLARNGQPPLFGSTIMAPPRVDPDWRAGESEDELSRWHREAGAGFEMGTLYTMVAGLLNILAIYDAFAGPVFSKPEEPDQRPPPEEGKGKGKDDEDDESNDE